MDKVNQTPLLKQLEFYSRLLEKHEAIKKEKELKYSTVQQLSQHSSLKQPSFSDYKMVKNPTQPVTSFDKKYSFQKSKHVYTTDRNRRTVLYNQNQNFKAKYVSSKNQTLKCVSPVNKNTFKSNTLNSNLLSVHKKPIVNFENQSDKTCVSSNDSGKLTSNTKDFIKEIESLTELLKKKSSASQPKLQSSTAKYDNVVQDKLRHKNYRYSACNNFKSVKNENIFPKTKNLTKMSPKIIPSNFKSHVNSRKISNCYTKINSNNRSNPHQLKTLIPNKFCYKKVDVKETLNSKATITSLKTVRNMDQSKNKFQKITSSPHSKKIIFSDFKNAVDNLCVSGNTSVFTSKPLSRGKQELIFTNKSVSSCSEVGKEFSNINEVKPSSFFKKSPSVFKSAKVIKLKPGGTRYTKINKCFTTPNKTLQLKYFVHQKTSSSKKTKRKVNSKYKVINKTLTPCANTKIVNSSSSLGCKENSPTAVDLDPFLKDLNDSAIDKLEKNLLALSTALTATPVSGKCEVNGSKMSQSLAKVNSKLCLKKTPLKKSKTRISKYKIVNSDVQNYSLKRKQNLINQRSDIKKIKQSKFSLINKYVQPMHVLTPVKQQKSILVKRLFKSKNAIINKNASPISYSAKMIKSKYLTLNKRKLSSWQKNNIYPRVPPHHSKFKGYSLMAKLHSKQNRYQKAAISAYHPRVFRKFTSYGCQTSRRQFSKSSSGEKYKRKINNGYVHSPVVFIHGMRYSLNSSGKTLKKLPVKGQTAKTFRRIGSKVLVRTPENSNKILTSTTNLASRALHRSINRILTASSKKSLTKVNAYCMFYNRFGRCNRGVKCTYIHDPSKIAVCTRFLRGTCKIDGCPFSHEIAPGKMAICSFFLVGVCEKGNCPYRHEKLSPDAVLCKAFVQGYCLNGKECKKAHILICPKYMQGDCDKGSSCAFPHPPQKVKRNVQTEVEDEEKKPTDVLLEKVFRYFQEGGDCVLPPENKSDENNTANSFVPKRRKLEEQPSFIPLCDSSATSHNN